MLDDVEDDVIEVVYDTVMDPDWIVHLVVQSTTGNSVGASCVIPLS